MYCTQLNLFMLKLPSLKNHSIESLGFKVGFKPNQKLVVVTFFFKFQLIQYMSAILFVYFVSSCTCLFHRNHPMMWGSLAGNKKTQGIHK